MSLSEETQNFISISGTHKGYFQSAPHLTPTLRHASLIRRLTTHLFPMRPMLAQLVLPSEPPQGWGATELRLDRPSKVQGSTQVKGPDSWSSPRLWDTIPWPDT